MPGLARAYDTVPAIVYYRLGIGSTVHARETHELGFAAVSVSLDTLVADSECHDRAAACGAEDRVLLRSPHCRVR